MKTLEEWKTLGKEKIVEHQKTLPTLPDLLKELAAKEKQLESQVKREEVIEAEEKRQATHLALNDFRERLKVFDSLFFFHFDFCFQLDTFSLETTKDLLSNVSIHNSVGVLCSAFCLGQLPTSAFHPPFLKEGSCLPSENIPLNITYYIDKPELRQLFVRLSGPDKENSSAVIYKGMNLTKLTQLFRTYSNSVLGERPGKFSRGREMADWDRDDGLENVENGNSDFPLHSDVSHETSSLPDIPEGTANGDENVLEEKMKIIEEAKMKSKEKEKETKRRKELIRKEIRKELQIDRIFSLQALQNNLLIIAFMSRSSEYLLHVFFFFIVSLVHFSSFCVRVFCRFMSKCDRDISIKG